MTPAERRLVMTIATTMQEQMQKVINHQHTKLGAVSDDLDNHYRAMCKAIKAVEMEGLEAPHIPPEGIPQIIGASFEEVTAQ